MTEYISTKDGSQDVLFGFGKAPGTFGELLQGVFLNNKKFLVSLPIKKYACAKFIANNDTNFTVFPPNKTKALNMVQLLAKHCNISHGGELYLDGDLPEGKGLASSSADLVASARAFLDFFKIHLPNEYLGKLMQNIEPSNAVMYDEVVSYYYSEGKLHKVLGKSPKVTILGIDEGGVVDTIEFNKIPKLFTETEKLSFELMSNTLAQAINEGDLLKIGAIATQSSIINQRIKKNLLLDALLNICDKINGLGVVSAHSGTYIGILLDSESTILQYQIEEGIKKLNTINDTASIFYIR